jgi:hypothetical protein
VTKLGGPLVFGAAAELTDELVVLVLVAVSEVGVS